MFRIAILLSALCALAACAVPTTQVDDPKRDLGDFELGHNIVVAPDIVKGPLSREASLALRDMREALQQDLD